MFLVEGVLNWIESIDLGSGNRYRRLKESSIDEEEVSNELVEWMLMIESSSDSDDPSSNDDRPTVFLDFAGTGFFLDFWSGFLTIWVLSASGLFINNDKILTNKYMK